MPVKKKDDKPKKKAKPKIPMEPFDFTPPTILELGAKPSEFISCKICCTALPHLNFSWAAVPTELSIGAIKEAIAKRHGGGLPELTLYKDIVHPSNSLSHATDSSTLKEMGIEGVVMGGEQAALPTVTLHYDFSAPRADDPIASIEPDPLESKHDIPMKQYRRLTAAAAAGGTGPGAAGRSGPAVGGAGGAARPGLPRPS